MFDASMLIAEFLKEHNWVVICEVFDHENQNGEITVSHFDKKLRIYVRDGVKVSVAGAMAKKPIDLHDPGSLQEILKEISRLHSIGFSVGYEYDEFDEEI